MLLKTIDFAGIQPLMAVHRLGQNQAQTALNCKFINGTLEPWRENSTVRTVPLGTKSIFLYKGLHWLTSVHDFDIVVGPIINDTEDRIYKTSENTYPQMSLSGFAESNVFFRLGVPAPTAAPVLESTYTLPTGTITNITTEVEDVGPLIVTSADHGLESNDRVTISMANGMVFLDGNVYGVTVVDDDTFQLPGTAPQEGFPFEGTGSWELYRDISEEESRAYCYTYVTDSGEEGVPSDLSTIDVYADASVQLSGMLDPPAGNYRFGAAALKRIYRSVTSSTGTDLYLVGEVSISTTSFLDDIDPTSIGELLPSADWDMPAEDMQGLVAMPNGILAGFRGKELCFSVPFMPHAWPIDYRRTVDSDIVAIGVIGQSLVVTTKEQPYIATGTDSASMTMEKLEIKQSCTSKRGLVDMGYSVVYPSPDGLVEVLPSDVRPLTKVLFSRDQWQDIVPTHVTAFFWEGKYIFFNNSKGYVLTPGDPTMSELDEVMTAGYNDLESDDLYILQGTSLKKYEGGTALKQYEWKSKVFRIQKPHNFSYAQVFRANSGEVTFYLYAEGVLIHTEIVADSEPFRLPGGTLGIDYEYELIGNAKVDAVYVADSIEELRNI